MNHVIVIGNYIEVTQIITFIIAVYNAPNMTHLGRQCEIGSLLHNLRLAFFYGTASVHSGQNDGFT